MELLTDNTYAMTLYGATVIGVVAGALGTFAYLRKQSMISDVISHSALPGVLVVFLLLTASGHSGRNLLGLMIGAVAAGTAAVYVTNLIPRISRVRLDAAMAVALSSFFGLGMLLMQYISHNPIPDKGGVQDYLFGNAPSITRAELLVSVVVGVITLAVVALFFKEFTLQSFDRRQAHVMGFNNTLIDALMFGAIAVATVIGLKSVGLVLMVAFLVTPPAIARQWTTTAASMTVVSGLVGGAASAIGTWLSIAYGPMPTGPVIVVTLFVLLLASLALSPRRRHAMAEA